MDENFVKELDKLIWKFLKIADELSHKLSYYVSFSGIRRVTSEMVYANFVFRYGYPVSDTMETIGIRFDNLEDIDSIVQEIIDSRNI